jgi:hypothetical protein
MILQLKTVIGRSVLKVTASNTAGVFIRGPAKA